MDFDAFVDGCFDGFGWICWLILIDSMDGWKPFVKSCEQTPTRLESTRFVAVSGGRDHMVAITDAGTWHGTCYFYFGPLCFQHGSFRRGLDVFILEVSLDRCCWTIWIPFIFHTNTWLIGTNMDTTLDIDSTIILIELRWWIWNLKGLFSSTRLTKVSFPRLLVKRKSNHSTETVIISSLWPGIKCFRTFHQLVSFL